MLENIDSTSGLPVTADTPVTSEVIVTEDLPTTVDLTTTAELPATVDLTATAEVQTTAELPAISADPLQLVVDFGSPNYLLKQQRRHKQLHDELHLLARTNDYRPTRFTVVAQLNHVVKHMHQSVPELRDVINTENWTTKLLKDDMEQCRQYEQADPLKGNSLAVTSYNNTEIMIFSAGSSLSSLVIATLQPEITIQYSVDLEYPIRQITLSPLSTTDVVIFLIRTTSSLHLFEMNEKISLIHELNFPKLSNINPRVDYSMPVDAQLSPFYKHDYLFITNNGYMALIDGVKQQHKFEHMDAISESTPYSSRWRSCAFSISPTRIYIASPESVKEFTFRDSLVISKTLVTPKENIVAFKTLGRVYCYATLTSIIVMDIVFSQRPLFTWIHRMRDGPPTDLLLHAHDDQWRITAYSNTTQRYSMLFFKGPIETEINELHTFNLSVSKFEEIFNHTSRIYTVGCCLLATTDNMYRIFRAFEDGSIRVQYMTLGDDIQFTPPSPTPLKSESRHFNKLLNHTARDTMPESHSLLSTTEVIQLNPRHYTDYLHHDVISGTEKITDTMKRNTAQNLELLKSTTPFRDVYKEYANHTLHDLDEFRDQMLLHEDIQLVPSPITPGLLVTPTKSQLGEAHEKLISLSRCMIRPIRENPDRFQYLDKDLVYVSTTTSKALAELWPINNTPFDAITYPILNTEHVLKPERFETSSNKRPREEVLLDVPPQETRSLDMQDPSPSSSRFEFTSTQPLPGVFGSRVKKATKKVIKKPKKTSGFR